MDCVSVPMEISFENAERTPCSFRVLSLDFWKDTISPISCQTPTTTIMGAITNSIFASTLSQLLNAPRLSSVTAAAGRVTTTVQQLNQQCSGYVNQIGDATT